MLPFQMENGSPGDFPLPVYRLLIMQTDLSFVRLLLKKQTEVFRFQTD
jgi:hypothetical protein